MSIGAQLLGGVALGSCMAFIALLLTERSRRCGPRIMIGMGLAGFWGLFMGGWALLAAMLTALLLAWAAWLKPVASGVSMLLHGLVSGLAGNAKRARRPSSARAGRWLGDGGRSGGGGASGRW